MYRVGVCDDERILARRLEQSLSELFAERGAAAEIALFLSGEELLKAAESLDLVFLDIDMPGMDGIETGKRLNRRNPECKIVMVSAMEDRMKDGYRVGAKRFVTKPVDLAELREAVDALLAENPGSREIRLFLNNQAFTMRQNQIGYLEAYNGYTVFHVGKNLFRREENLKHFSEELDPRIFVQISRKHIVNLEKVNVSARADSLRLAEETLPISRRLREEFRRRYTEYDLAYGGL